MMKLGIERPPAIDAIDDEDSRVYIRVIEALARTGSGQEIRNSLDPRTWPMSTHVAVITAVLLAFGWAFNSGGEWKQIKSEQQAMQIQISQFETTYARRDLVEQQMGFVNTNLNEMKVKLDALLAAQRAQ